MVKSEDSPASFTVYFKRVQTISHCATIMDCPVSQKPGNLTRYRVAKPDIPYGGILYTNNFLMSIACVGYWWIS